MVLSIRPSSSPLTLFLVSVACCIFWSTPRVYLRTQLYVIFGHEKKDFHPEYPKVRLSFSEQQQAVFLANMVSLFLSRVLLLSAYNSVFNCYHVSRASQSAGMFKHTLTPSRDLTCTAVALSSICPTLFINISGKESLKCGVALLQTVAYRGCIWPRCILGRRISGVCEERLCNSS